MSGLLPHWPRHWRQLGRVWLALPPQPVGIIQFIGGNGLAVQPQWSYQRLLRAFEAQGWGVFTWAYRLSLDHQQQADQAFLDLERVLRRQPNLADLPLLRVGHSLGCKLLLLAPDGGLGCGGAAMLAFNNYAAGRSIPLVNQLGPSLGFTVEFNPPPRRTMELVAEHYRQPRNLLVRFRDDTIDQSPHLHAQLKARSGDQSRLVVLPGKHTAPASAGLRQQLLGMGEDAKGRRIKRLAHQVLVLGQELVGSTPAPLN
ncbi:DUF1350 family protein [Candidatus Synechococcus spongiarum]|uniref:DUF1350 family protein n=1 Tax=Candidatus Synechococcus spongiarum TaxID=431041 RepID=UPI0009C156EC|nr:DUF1350 family protein [Candidatus Synechococcus spongiarum]